jgi:hypothetical protein
MGWLIIALLAFSPLLLDLFRGGSSKSDKMIIIGIYVVLIGYIIWFYSHPRA